MARARAKKTDATQENGSGGQAPDSPSITKVEAVKNALAAGKESPADGTEFIKSNYGIEMNPQHFSSVKSQLKKKEGTAKPGRKPRAASRAVEGYVAPPPKIVPTGEGDLIDALERMKPLVASLGAEKVHRLVDLLG